MFNYFSDVTGESVDFESFLSKSTDKNVNSDSRNFDEMIAEHCRETISRMSTTQDEELSVSRSVRYGSDEGGHSRVSSGGSSSDESEVGTNSIKRNLKKLVQKKRKEKQKEKIRSSGSSDEEEELNKENKEVLSKTNKKSKFQTRITSDDSSCEEENPSAIGNLKTLEKKERTEKKEGKIRSSGSSDEEEGLHLSNENKEVNKSNTKGKSQTKITDGSSSEEENYPARSNKKRILSDSEAEEENKNDEIGTREGNLNSSLEGMGKRQKIISDESSDEESSKNSQMPSQKRARLSSTSDHEGVQPKPLPILKRKLVIESDEDD